LLHTLASIDHFAMRDLHDRIAEIGMMIMSTIPAELANAESRAYEGALSRCRVVLAAIFGEPEERSFDVKFWDGSIDRGNNPRSPFTFVLTRPAALRRMLLPPSELSIVESYLSGDVEIEGSMEAASNLADMIGKRANRRHRPGRGFEAVRYRFEIVADYGAFRDLQRHRMLTVQWQTLSPDLGAGVPEQVDLAGVGDEYRRALEVSRLEYERLAGAGLASAAPYALCLGYRLRFILDLNAREAMQLIELRSGREGHPSYRAVAHEMHAQIARVHPMVAAAMSHVDTEAEPRLERILSEMRTHARAAARP